MELLMDVIGSMTSQAMVEPDGRFARILAYAFAIAVAAGGGFALASLAAG